MVVDPTSRADADADGYMAGSVGYVVPLVDGEGVFDRRVMGCESLESELKVGPPPVAPPVPLPKAGI